MKQWHGPVPESCDICASPIVDEFIDGATTLGSWANMCPACFAQMGSGIGPGRGQHYKRDPDIPGANIIGVYRKVAG